MRRQLDFAVGQSAQAAWEQLPARVRGALQRKLERLAALRSLSTVASEDREGEASSYGVRARYEIDTIDGCLRVIDLTPVG